MGERLDVAVADVQEYAPGCAAVAVAESAADYVDQIAQLGSVGNAIAAVAIGAAIGVTTAECIHTAWALTRAGYYITAMRVKAWGFGFTWGGDASN